MQQLQQPDISSHCDHQANDEEQLLLVARVAQWPRSLCVRGERELLCCCDVHNEEGHRMLLCIDAEALDKPALLYSAVPEHTDNVHRRIEPCRINCSPCSRRPQRLVP